MGGIIILLTPAPVIDSFRAWKASLFHKDTASWCQQHLNLRLIVDQYALQVLEDSLIPDPPDVGHAGQEAEEGGEAGGQHHGVLRQPVVSEEDKGQQEVGVGGTCNNNLTHLTMAFSPYKSSSQRHMSNLLNLNKIKRRDRFFRRTGSCSFFFLSLYLFAW